MVSIQNDSSDGDAIYLSLFVPPSKRIQKHRERLLCCSYEKAQTGPRNSPLTAKTVAFIDLWTLGSFPVQEHWLEVREL